jgi:diaminohydroxyphosphoribosylaminopyrimidine deaminase/5-amino-6-(5-phosphoribosylamino)uracil reductase
LAVTLEPCCFTGRTGPCTDAILEAGIGRVVIGCRDPHARVSGRGIRQLRRARVEIEVGVREDECRRHHRGFFSLCKAKRPFVILKLASTLDGRIATASGESRWITGPQSREEVHRMRSRVDAVMVGSNTALADDPELSARRAGRIVHRPIRILVDSRLRLGTGAKLYQGLGGDCADPPGRASARRVQPSFRTWVLTAARARGRREVAATGAQLIDVPKRDSHLDLAAGLRALGERGLTSVLVEGGGGLASALLRADVVDEIHWFQAPMLLGGDARPALGPLGIEELSSALELTDVKVRRVGEDLHTRAGLVRRDARSGRGSGGSRGGRGK